MQDRSYKVEFLLWEFGGIFGLHKFYERKYSQGILYFLTVGLFIFGWIIDIFKLFPYAFVYSADQIEEYEALKIEKIKEKEIEKQEKKKEKAEMSRVRAGQFIQEKILELEGKLGKKIVLYDDRIVIDMGYLPFSKHREKTISIRNISSIEVKKPSLSSGFILFQIIGEESKSRKSIDDTPSDNEVLFGSMDKYKIALKIKEYIENYTSESRSYSGNDISNADELSKFRKLLDDGIISNEEFERQKSKLLG